MTAFPLPRLTEDLRLLALDLSGQEPEPELIGARLMDGLRDAGVTPLVSAAFTEATSAFRTPEWQRLDLLARTFRETAVKPLVAESLKKSPERVAAAFLLFCTREAQLLTLELLLKSPFRIEELARKWVAALGGTIQGETEKESRKQLERLDFGGVLKNLEAADKDRAARIQKMKELEAKRLAEQQEAYARQGRE